MYKPNAESFLSTTKGKLDITMMTSSTVVTLIRMLRSMMRHLPKEEKKDLIVKTALSIGLKSIQMSEVNMDCHSYIDPIREIVSHATSENTDKIQEIDAELFQMKS